MRRGGFTLLEVMAVVTLLGLLAGATAWSLAEDARGGLRGKAVADIAHADRMARLAAQRGGQGCGLRFDLRQQRFWRVVGPEDRSEKSHEMSLPGSSRIDRVWTAATDSSDDVAPPEGTDALVTVWYSSAGCAESFALRLVFEDGESGKPASDSLSGRSVWIVFAGLTGQLTLVQDEAEAENLFAQLTGHGPDAP